MWGSWRKNETPRLVWNPPLHWSDSFSMRGVVTGLVRQQAGELGLEPQEWCCSAASLLVQTGRVPQSARDLWSVLPKRTKRAIAVETGGAQVYWGLFTCFVTPQMKDLNSILPEIVIPLTCPQLERLRKHKHARGGSGSMVRMAAVRWKNF